MTVVGVRIELAAAGGMQALFPADHSFEEPGRCVLRQLAGARATERSRWLDCVELSDLDLTGADIHAAL